MNEETMRRLIGKIQSKANEEVAKRRAFSSAGTPQDKLLAEQCLGKASGCSDSLMIIREEDEKMFDKILAETSDIGEAIVETP